MKSILTAAIVGAATGIITATSGLTTIPRPVFIGVIAIGVVLAITMRRHADKLIRVYVGITAWVVSSFIALNYLLPHTSH